MYTDVTHILILQDRILAQKCSATSLANIDGVSNWRRGCVCVQENVLDDELDPIHHAGEETNDWIDRANSRKQVHHNQSSFRPVIAKRRRTEWNQRWMSHTHTHTHTASQWGFSQLPFLPARTYIIRYQKPPKLVKICREMKRISDKREEYSGSPTDPETKWRIEHRECSHYLFTLRQSFTTLNNYLYTACGYVTIYRSKLFIQATLHIGVIYTGNNGSSQFCPHHFFKASFAEMCCKITLLHQEMLTNNVDALIKLCLHNKKTTMQCK